MDLPTAGNPDPVRPSHSEFRADIQGLRAIGVIAVVLYHADRRLLPGVLLLTCSQADAHGIVPETLSRGFAKVYGTTAATFRAEIRARRALGQIIRTGISLVEIAAAVGFADQAHMTRAVRALTGATPTYWRSKSNSFKTVPAQ